MTHLYLTFATLWHLDIIKADVLLSMEAEGLHHLDGCTDCDSCYQLKCQQANAIQITGCKRGYAFISIMYLRLVATLHKHGFPSCEMQCDMPFCVWDVSTPQRGRSTGANSLTARESFLSVILRVQANDSGMSRLLTVLH